MPYRLTFKSLYNKINHFSFFILGIIKNFVNNFKKYLLILIHNKQIKLKKYFFYKIYILKNIIFSLKHIPLKHVLPLITLYWLQHMHL